MEWVEKPRERCLWPGWSRWSHPQGGDTGARNSKAGERKEREAGPGEMKPEAKPPRRAGGGWGSPAGEGGREGEGEEGRAPASARSLGREEAPDRLQPPLRPWSPAGCPAPEEGGQVGGTRPPRHLPATPIATVAHPPPQDRGGGLVGERGLCPQGLGPSAGPAFPLLGPGR
jgi:hypothetical protein